MLIPDDHVAISAFRTRPPERHPQNPFCERHLRRICGVCPHFAGDLTTAVPAACGQWGFAVDADRDARHCRFWTRRDQEPGA